MISSDYYVKFREALNLFHSRGPKWFIMAQTKSNCRKFVKAASSVMLALSIIIIISTSSFHWCPKCRIVACW